jgi:hypothetical protein
LKFSGKVFKGNWKNLIKSRKLFLQSRHICGNIKMQPGYNTTETSHALWTAALNVQDTSNKFRGRVKKSEIIHHPQFEAASRHVEDQYWKVILHNCARKKFPRGFVFSDGLLRHRTNNISIALPDDDYALAQTAIYFFQENGKLYSKRDQEIRKKRDEDAILAQLVTASNNWTCISRSKNRRATYIRDYVERCYSHLHQHIRDELYTQLNVGFETKFITKDNVRFESGQVLHIDGVDANETRVFFTRALPVKRLAIIDRSTQTKDKSYRHYDNWCKYVEDYRKYIVNSAKSSHTVVQTSNYLSNDHDSEGPVSGSYGGGSHGNPNKGEVSPNISEL